MSFLIKDIGKKVYELVIDSKSKATEKELAASADLFAVKYCLLKSKKQYDVVKSNFQNEKKKYYMQFKCETNDSSKVESIYQLVEFICQNHKSHLDIKNLCKEISLLRTQ